MSKVNVTRFSPWLSWSIGVLFVVLVFGFQSGYAIISPPMGRELGLTIHEVSLISSVYTWCFAVVQLVSGSLLDRAGAQRVQPIACTLFVLGIFCFAFSGNAVQLMAAQIFLATGAAFAFVGAGFIGGMWFAPARFGLMFALVQFAASTTAFLGQNFLALMLAHYPWSWIVNGIGMFGLLLVIAMFLFLRDPPERQLIGWPRNPLSFARSVLSDIAAVVRIPGMPANLMIGAVSFGVMLAVGVLWGPKIVAAHISHGGSSGVAALAWLGLAFGAPVVARLSDWLGNRKYLLLATMVMQGLLLLAMLSSLFSATATLAMLMFCFGFASGGSMLPFTIGMELAGPRHAGTASALVNGAQFLAGGILLFASGSVFSEMHGLPGLRYALSVLPLAILLALPIFLRLRETGLGAAKR